MKTNMLILGCAAALLLLTGCHTLTPPLSVSDGKDGVITVPSDSTVGIATTDAAAGTAASIATTTTATIGSTTADQSTAHTAAATTNQQTVTTAKQTIKKATTTTTAKPTVATAKATTKRITTAKPATTTAKPTTAAVTDVSAIQQEVLRLVNAERAKEGLPALSYCYAAQAAADIRAQELIQSFSHTRPDGTSCFTAFDGLGLTYMAAGENIAAGYTSPAAVMNGWMNSSGHKANILNSNFNAIVVGYQDNHWVQLFLKL